MEKNHACPSFPHFIHGGDYNPEQWIDDKSVWDEDMRLMKLAGCNELTVGIFSWAKLEPREGEYDFSFLDEIIEKIGNNGGKVILATPSGARPHWLAEKYPEVLRVNRELVRARFQGRHNHCYTSPIYRQKVRAINTRLAERYGHNPTVVAWHISNEYGGECHCPLCAAAFRDFLREKFHGDIQELNRAYWTTFWSHNYDSFEQIDPPGRYTETSSHGLIVDWRRFVTRQTVDFMTQEVAPLKAVNPDLPVTTNMMYGFYDLDYYQFRDVLDFASWDAYPEWHSGNDTKTAQEVGFWHDFFRSLKQKPFLLMESTPSLVNWKPFNKPKRPGMDVLASIQPVAHGSDSVQYFQFRKGRGSCEKFHGAVVGHDGTENTRVFRAVQTVGDILKKIDEISGTVCRPKVAIVFDWENMWALDDCQGYAWENKKYYNTCYAYHKVLWERGIDCDIVSRKDDLTPYRLVIAPMLYMTDRQTEENLCRYVEQGGILYSTYITGTVDENDLCHLGGIPGGKLKEVFGITAEEIDTLYPQERQHALCRGVTHELVDYCEVIHLQGAQVLATYEDGWYAGLPAATRNTYGKGVALYQACRDSQSRKEVLLTELLQEAGIESVVDTRDALPRGVTAHSRTDGEHTYIFVENYDNADTPTVKLRAPMENMLTGELTDRCTLPLYGFGIFRSV